MSSIVVINAWDCAALTLALVGEEYSYFVTSHNYDFNISTSESASIKEPTEIFWRNAKGGDVPLHLVSDETYEYGVEKPIFSVDNARKTLELECTSSLCEMLNKVTPGIKSEVESGII